MKIVRSVFMYGPRSRYLCFFETYARADPTPHFVLIRRRSDSTRHISRRCDDLETVIAAPRRIICPHQSRSRGWSLASAAVCLAREANSSRQLMKVESQ